jgi:hypothetical protein
LSIWLSLVVVAVEVEILQLVLVAVVEQVDLEPEHHLA